MANCVKPFIKRHLLPFKPLPALKAVRDVRFESGEVVYLITADDGQAFEWVQPYSFLDDDVKRFNETVFANMLNVAGYDLYLIGQGGSASLLVDYQLEIVMHLSCVDGVWMIEGGLFTEQSADMQMQLKMLKMDKASKLLN